MKNKERATKILFLDNDEHSFAIRQCIARALVDLPPVELFHASDATEALSMLEELTPDVIVLDEEVQEECDLLLDSLGSSHPPIVLQTEKNIKNTPALGAEITYLQKSESLEGMHKTLVLATSIGSKKGRNLATKGIQ